jgi:catechol 2,3-dioxygenase-like lactoylglutathione lyase family enzyme
MNAHRLTHIGVCVAELERSVVFYRDVLGFEEMSRLEMQGPITERLLDIAGGELQAVYLKLGGTVIELLYYPSAGHIAEDVPRPMNRLGLSHISLTVADPDAVAQAIAHSGGAILEQTRFAHEGVTRALFVTDPDGMRIELVRGRSESSAAPGG